jgi:AcrR family transcriptional regulator
MTNRGQVHDERRVREAGERRARLSDEQTARRVLDAALAQLAERGVSVGLDQVRFEDVIRAADVSRSSAYRRWPTRDALVEDVLVELAHGAYQPGVGAIVAGRAAEVVASHAAQAADPAGRHDLFVELVRLTFEIDLAATAASREFRSYLALRAAFAGIESDELRSRIAAALAVGDRRTVARGAAVLTSAARLFGMRLVAPLAAPEGFEVVARALFAASVGFVVAAQSDPSLLSTTRDAAAYGSSSVAAWSVPVYAMTGLVLQHLEPDPGARRLPAAELLAGLARIVGEGADAAAAVSGS